MHDLKVSELNDHTVGELFDLMKMQSETILELEKERDAALSGRRRDPEGDPLLRATGYRLDTDPESKQVRLVLWHGAEADVLAWMTLDTFQQYEMSEKLLKAYDKFEGIK